jgi:Fe-S-cluster containining protein
MACRACGACCRTVRVPLTDLDLFRLQQATGQSREQLVDWLTPNEVDMTGEPESFVWLAAGRRLLTLAHRAGGCCLLDASGRCSAYAARPQSCRLYPWDGAAALPGATCDHAREAPPDCAELAAVLRVELGRYTDRVVAYNRRQRLRRWLRRQALAEDAFWRFLEGV